MKNNINKTVLQTLFYSLVISFFIGAGDLFAQDNNDFQWIWAKSGGSGGRIHNEASYYLDKNYGEMIFDIATDNDNNYYFLANIATYLANIDGMPIYSPGKTSANSYHAPNRNFLIMSFTCDGQYRWHKIIGTGAAQYIDALALDNQGGLYVSAKLTNYADEDQINHGVPNLCFSEDNCLAHYSMSMHNGVWSQDPYVPHEGWKEGFLLKYNTDNGDFVWRRDFQGLVTIRTGSMHICGGGVQIDSNNILHNIVGLRKGVHLDGAIVIDDEDEFKYHYYLIKYDTDGNLVAPPLLLPMSGNINSTGAGANLKMKYNETLNRYYIAGYYATMGNFVPLSFNGYNFWQSPPDPYSAYGVIFSFTPDDLDDWWHKELFKDESSPYSNKNRIYDIVLDDNGDIYILGTVDTLNGVNKLFWGFCNYSSYRKIINKYDFCYENKCFRRCTMGQCS